MEHTAIDRPADLGHLIRTARNASNLRQDRAARSVGCSPKLLSDLELGLLTAFPIVTLELLRRRLELDPVLVDAYTGALWRDPPRGGTCDLPCCHLRVSKEP